MDKLLGTDEKLDLVVRSRAKTYYDGQARAVTSVNETGQFDVLPQHANFITLVEKFIDVVKDDGENLKFEIKTGVMRVFGNKIEVYLTV